MVRAMQTGALVGGKVEATRLPQIVEQFLETFRF